MRLPEKIDVVMCTYNSNKRFFKYILLRILDEVPVHCFIVVDRFSSDGTIGQILAIFPNAKIVSSNENLGVARKLGVDSVDTPLFAFVDDDVLLLRGWYDYARKLIKGRIGAVSCYAKSSSALLRGIYEYEKPKAARVCDPIVSSKNNVDSQRGFTYATLIRKEAIANWKPNSILSACEDHEILRHIVKKGFLWLTSYRVFAEHLGDPQSLLFLLRHVWRKTAWNAAGCRLTKLIKLNPIQLFFRTFLYFLSGLEITGLSGNPFAFPYYCTDGLAFLYGYICWKEKLFMKR